MMKSLKKASELGQAETVRFGMKKSDHLFCCFLQLNIMVGARCRSKIHLKFQVRVSDTEVRGRHVTIWLCTKLSYCNSKPSDLQSQAGMNVEQALVRYIMNVEGLLYAKESSKRGDISRALMEVVIRRLTPDGNDNTFRPFKNDVLYKMLIFLSTTYLIRYS